MRKTRSGALRGFKALNKRSAQKALLRGIRFQSPERAQRTRRLPLMAIAHLPMRSTSCEQHVFIFIRSNASPSTACASQKTIPAVAVAVAVVVVVVVVVVLYKDAVRIRGRGGILPKHSQALFPDRSKEQYDELVGVCGPQHRKTMVTMTNNTIRKVICPKIKKFAVWAKTKATM